MIVKAELTSGGWPLPLVAGGWSLLGSMREAKQADCTLHARPVHACALGVP